MSLTKCVTIREECITIPTYKVDQPEKNPLFIEKRAYQGSTGKVYPLPVTEKIYDFKEDVSYTAVTLENDFLKVMVLPALGGRIQRAYDKTNGYDFVYYNKVIKPALVGLTGPWISGGIEFNWPQHHRPSTYSPVDYTLSENKDGSCTIYVGETDKMYGTKGMAAITLYPGKAYIEIKGQLYNHTDLPQTFLWWANPAVPVNDDTYSVFPPDVNAVMDHGKRAVSTFPIATGEYYKYDYSAGIDISKYKNIKVPTSYMAAQSDFDFVGNYDEKREAGLLHVADHHISPGKKQWTWGSGDFGKIWDCNLTDEDGPYIELMTGIFTDNQPDFSWLKPHEEKTFTQYFMPYKGIGRVGNATKDAVVGIFERPNHKCLIKVYTTGIYKETEITVMQMDSLLYRTIVDLSPTDFFETQIEAPENLSDCRITVAHNSKILVEYSVYQEKMQPVPTPAKPIPEPSEIKSLEELYLAATHLEQYRHASYEPAAYYMEGLKRDATDIRLNNGYGLLLYKRGLVTESISYFEAAIKKQTWRNPNPYFGESYFNLGISLFACNRFADAYDAFYKSTWNAETQSAGFYWLSVLSARKGAYEEALEFAEKSLIRNWHNMKARTLKAALLRILLRNNDSFLDESLLIDPLYMGCLYEKALFVQNFTEWKKHMRSENHNYLELSLDYAKAGFYEDACIILKHCEDRNPMGNYYIGWIYTLNGFEKLAIEHFEIAENSTTDCCFPNRVEEISILKSAISTMTKAPMAHYYLGCLFYDKKQYENAVCHWEQSAKQEPSFAAVYRNLSIACFNKKKQPERAMKLMEKACSLDRTYPRLWLEYDQLAAKQNLSIKKRLTVMESHPDITAARDDLFLRYITLLNCDGQYAKALGALRSRNFHPWEGAEGKAISQYRFALIQLAKSEILDGAYQKALNLLQDTLTYPLNLGEGKLPNVHDNEAYYYMGIAYKNLMNQNLAENSFRRATEGSQIPSDVQYYNDQSSDYIYYQGLAHQELGFIDLAKKSFHQLLLYGKTHWFHQVTDDFFAVSLPELEVFEENPQQKHEQYCRYLCALGNQGLGNTEEANKLFTEILEKQADYQLAKER